MKSVLTVDSAVVVCHSKPLKRGRHAGHPLRASVLSVSVSLALSACSPSSALPDRTAGVASVSGGSGPVSGGGNAGAALGNTAGAASGGGSATGSGGSGGVPSMAGVGTGGMPQAGGSGIGGTVGGGVCPLPAKFNWTTTPALAKVPRNIGGHNVTALKDFTSVVANGKHVVYMTAYEGGWKSALFTFTNWTDWGSGAGTWFPRNAVAPTLVYFTPKKIWVLTYQWGLQYATSDDPTDLSKWSGGKPLLNGGPAGALDQTFICDSTTCHLFFAGDNGKIYRSSMAIGDFPATFNGYETILSDATGKLFEAVEVYALKGLNKYLMIVEALGSAGRYFRAFTASSLGGTFTALPGADSEASPFAGKNNVTGAWSNDVSHGDLVRNDPSETQTVDLCNLQFLYQAVDKNAPHVSDYGLLPYQPGVLTLTQP
jgi:Glycosyl hydrolase family 62